MAARAWIVATTAARSVSWPVTSMEPLAVETARDEGYELETGRVTVER